jgi:hypothetical protein
MKASRKHVGEDLASGQAGIDAETVKQLRAYLHDLSSVFTGVLVSGGLLKMALEGDQRQRYSKDICEGAERGADVIRKARQLLTAPEERLGQGS